jgi:tetratricopeptide (TPR) repeat protein
MLGFSLYRWQWLAAALVVLLAVSLVCAHAPAVAKKTQTAGESKTATSAACRRGKALFGLGRFGAAEVAFEKDMETGTTIKCGREGLKKIGHRYPCVAARSLAKNGEKAESNKSYIELLKAKPRKQCARDGADSSSDPDVWDQLKTFSEDALTAISFAALAILILIGFLLLLLNLQAQIPRLRDLPPARRLRRPAVSIELLGDEGFGDKKVGAGATALLKERIETDAGKKRLDIASGEGRDVGSLLKAAGELGSQAKVGVAVVELLKMLLPRQRFKVSGHIQAKAAARGPGVSIELDRKLVPKGGITLWADEFSLSAGNEDEVDVVRRLMTPAAAWISYTVVQEVGEDPQVAEKAMSWARFKAGLEWQLEDQREMAEKLYELAVAGDAGNYGARINLGQLVGGDKAYGRAVELLEKALAIMEGR